MVLNLGARKGDYFVIYMRDNNNEPLLDKGILVMKFYKIYPYSAKVKEILEEKLREQKIESEYEKPENLIFPVFENQKIVGYETDEKRRAVYIAIRAIICANKIVSDNVELLLKAPGLEFFRYETPPTEQKIRVDKMLKLK